MISADLNGKEIFLNEIQKQTDTRSYKLIEKAVQILQHNAVRDENAPWGNRRCILPSRDRFPGIWNWDTAFHCIGMSRIDPEFAMEHMEAFCSFQLEDGMFPDVVFYEGKIVDTFSKPPVMAWTCEIVYRRSQDKSFLERMYPKLERNVQFWEKKRKNGVLFHYDAAEVNGKKDPASVRCESGWDNSVRWDMDKPEQLWAIDLNCFLIMTYRSMDFIAKELGNTATDWLEKEKELAKNVEIELWDEELGCYVDRNYCTNELSNVLTPASFI